MVKIPKAFEIILNNNPKIVSKINMYIQIMETGDRDKFSHYFKKIVFNKAERNLYEAKIDKNLRLIFTFENDDIILLNIVKHDDLIKVLSKLSGER